MIIISSCCLIAFALLFPFLLDPAVVGQRNFATNLLFLCIGFALMGTAFGPIGAFLPELFDANVRYSGSGIGYNLAAIVGAASCRPSPLGCPIIGACIPWACTSV